MHEGAQLPVEMIPVVHIMQPPSDEGPPGRQAHIGLQLQQALQRYVRSFGQLRNTQAALFSPYNKRRLVIEQALEGIPRHLGHVTAPRTSKGDRPVAVLADDLIASRARREMAGKSCYSFSSPMAVMVLKVSLHDGRNAAPGDLKRKRKL